MVLENIKENPSLGAGASLNVRATRLNVSTLFLSEKRKAVCSGNRYGIDNCWWGIEENVVIP